jgi:hypothetical protein
VRIVLVRQVVQVDELRPGRAQDALQILDHRSLIWIFYLSAGEAELDLAGVLAHISRFALLRQAHLLHLFIGRIAVNAGSRAAGAIGRHHAREPFLFPAKTLGDAVVGHDLDVVLVRGDGEVRGACQGGFGRQAIGNEEVRIGIIKPHDWSP